VRLRLALALAGLGTAVSVGCGGDTESPARVDPRLTTDVPPVVRHDCELAAAEMDSGVLFCPPLVPRGATTSQNRSSRGRFSTDASGDSYGLNFVADVAAGFDPSQPSGFRDHIGHWRVAAVDRRAELIAGPGAKAIAHSTASGVPLTVVERRWVAYGLDAGHVLALWSFAGRTFVVSLHGFENRDALLDMARASIAQMLACEPDDATDDGACSLVFASKGGG
jgi:hypothetical protein